MAEHIHTQVIPRRVLIAAGALMLASIGLAAGARAANLSARPAAVVPARQVRDIRFEDRPDGTLSVIDAATNTEACIVPPASNGFVRGVLRGMFRGRKLESMGRDGSFRLSREADGRLTLEDPQTGRRVDLDSFGPTNSAAFARFLVDARQATR